MTTLDLTNQKTLSRTITVWSIIALWFSIILMLARHDLLVTPDATIPVRMFTATILPPLIFWAAWRLIPAVRPWVASLDLALIAAMQGWRVVGTLFLMFWFVGDIPLIFAAPAGLGDIAVGVFAVFVAVTIARGQNNAKVMNDRLIWAGMIDFAAAFGTGVLSGRGLPLAFPGAPAPDLLQSLPLVMIPAFGVPMFMILHLIAFFKRRELDGSPIAPGLAVGMVAP